MEGKALKGGITFITWKATDANGNTSTCRTRVEIKSTVPDPKPFIQTKIAENLSSDKVLYQAVESRGIKFSIRVMPNPSSNNFTLKLNSESFENFKITVTDITGKMIEQKMNVPAQSAIQLGGKYHPGTYIAEIIQGNEKTAVKLFKMN